MPVNVFMFPGQGAQSVEMGKSLYDEFSVARDVFERAEDACSIPIGKLCFEGPIEKLSLTSNSQPCLLTVSIAALYSAREMGLAEPEFALGLSLGEYTALCAADVLSLEDAVKLVYLRGSAMQDAAFQNPGTMTSFLGAESAVVEEIVRNASAKGIISIANYNCPGQIVISGELAAIEEAERLAKDARRMRAIRLNVSGAFHSPLMQPAADRLAEALDSVSWGTPRFPVVQNCTARPHYDIEEIKHSLVAQLTGSVRFEGSLKWLFEQGASSFYEIGPGKVLAGLLRRTDRERKAINIGTAEQAKALP